MGPLKKPLHFYSTINALNHVREVSKQKEIKAIYKIVIDDNDVIIISACADGLLLGRNGYHGANYQKLQASAKAQGSLGNTLAYYE